MATVHFYLQSKLNKLAPVYLRFSVNRSEFFVIKTPFLMVPDYWNAEKQSLKQRILFTQVFSESEAKDVEDRFVKLKDFILREHFALSGPTTKQWLIDTVNKFYYKAQGSESFNDYIRRFIEEAKAGKRLATSGNVKRKYSYGSIRALTGFMLSWYHFQGIKIKIPDKGHNARWQKWEDQPYKEVNFNDVNIDVYNEFVTFFYNRGCGANYIGRNLKSLKTIFRSAREEGLHDNKEIERKAFKVISEDASNVYLTEAELKSLFELDLSKNKLYSIVRDVFLVGCYTAQRYSDYSKINKNNLKEVEGKKYIELIQKKTGERCIIPVRPELDIILKRYDYTLPKTFEQKVNSNIKKIAATAGITELIETEKIKGGLKVKSFISKSELIKTHTARRTGCSLMYLSGIAPIDIMKISGHKTEREFLKYIRIGKEETAHSLSSHPYFVGSVLSVAK